MERKRNANGTAKIRFRLPDGARLRIFRCRAAPPMCRIRPGGRDLFSAKNMVLFKLTFLHHVGRNE